MVNIIDKYLKTRSILKISLLLQKNIKMARVSIMRILMVFAATAMLVDMVVAVDYIVGRPNGGWDLSTNLSEWASSQSFSAGDNLDFQFDSTHDVLEVTRENYDSCGLRSPISTTVTSPARFPLTAEGSRYFICGRGTHCSQGMKVQIDVDSTAADGPTTASPPPPVRGVIVDPPSSAMSLKMAAGSILGFGVLIMILLSL